MVNFGRSGTHHRTRIAIPMVRSTLPTVSHKGYPQEQSQLGHGHSREDIKDTTACEHRSHHVPPRLSPGSWNNTSEMPAARLS